MSKIGAKKKQNKFGTYSGAHVAKKVRKGGDDEAAPAPQEMEFSENFELDDMNYAADLPDVGATEEVPSEPGPETVPAEETVSETSQKQPRARQRRLSMGQKRWRKLSKWEMLILLIPALAAAVMAVCLFAFRKQLMQITLEDAPCQYYANNIYRIESGAILRRTDKDETILKTSSDERTLSSLPIYHENKTAVTLPQNMMYYAPRNGIYGRVDYFTQVRLDRGKQLIAEREGKETVIQAGFLYDGNDFYVFLEPVILSFNGYKMELPAMSYVEARFNGSIMVFDAGSKEFLTEAPTTDVVASIVGGDYSVSLLGDSMTDRNGERTLLFTRPELLDPVFQLGD